MDDTKDDGLKRRQLASRNSAQWFVACNKSLEYTIGYISDLC